MFNSNYSPEPSPSVELIRAIRSCLSPHVGRHNAIAREHLFNLVYHQVTTTDRQLRAAINFLRKQGELILSTGGEKGGYWLAQTRQEAEEYLQAELLSRISDLSQQERAMRVEIDRRFAQVVQERLL